MTNCIKRRIQVFCVLFSAVLAFLTSAGAKPTITFSLSQSFSSIPSLSSWTQQFVEKRNVNQMKSYSGKRIRNDTLIMIYYHDQTIAVTELGPEKLLIGCELIEIYKDEDGKRLLKELSKFNRPLEISFQEMLKLMKQCDLVDRMTMDGKEQDDETSDSNNQQLAKRAIFPRSPFSLLSGIIPGTKWCGTGDIAASYNDLGTQNDMDRCCRSHDLCPKKVRAYQNRYDLDNDSLYTKSHCICDDLLYSCLKKANTSAAQLMGSIYFNLVQVPCVHEVNGKHEFRAAREGF